jgi:hypothetical protein
MKRSKRMTAYQYDSESGEFLMGIPARDLNEHDVAELDERTREALAEYVKSGGELYSAVHESQESGGHRPQSNQSSGSQPTEEEQ